MRPILFIRIASFASVLFFATASYSQPAPAPAASPTPVQVLYTGKLLGYFRMHAAQRRTDIGCFTPAPATDTTSENSPDIDSRAATKFLEQRRIEKHAILIATGDNFAPQLEAREFYRDAAHLVQVDSSYAFENKELFYGSDNGWIRYDAKNVPELEKLSDRIDAGVGTIPSDNVGCFLAAARFAAIVPGKHDFYFGAERVRQLARFMAGLPDTKKDGLSPDEEHDLSDEEKYDRPPQMLGSNLVIKSVRIDGQVTRPDLRSSPWFTADWPKEFGQVTNIQEGGSVYPWFTGVHIRVMSFRLGSNLAVDLNTFLQGRPPSEKLLSDFVEKVSETPGSKDTAYLEELEVFKKTVQSLMGKSIYMCGSKSDPNELKRPDLSECLALMKSVRISGSSVFYDLPLTEGHPLLVDPDPEIDDLKSNPKNQHVTFLTPAKNYGLCLLATGAKAQGNKPPQTNCLRFSVHTPFFYFPFSRPSVVKSTSKKREYYVDPDPFVFLKKNKSRPSDVVIFGVVDPHLGEQVGILNFSWQSKSGELKTVVSAEDPAQALREQQEYFQFWYQKVYGEKKFSGLKILLVQASPERARIFSTKFPDFQIVVTAADEAQGTSETSITTDWKATAHASSFVAVPLPYYHPSIEQGMVHFGSIVATPKGNSWNLSSQIIEPRPVPSTKAAPTEFWARIGGVLPQCLPEDFQPNDKPSGLDRMKWLTLCAMRAETGADVALLQKRDFFDQLPIESGETREDIQQILSRVIWKGDLLTLLYVPGSALKKALQQSKSYQSEDSSPLSVVDERWRQLEYLGIKFNSNTRDYLINEVPIDDKRVYSIATSDYVEAGDTGYPDLAAAALNPRTHAAAFPAMLKPISVVVCRKLYPAEADNLCNEEIRRKEYLDTSNAAQTVPYRKPSFAKKFWDLFPFRWPSSDRAPASTSDALQQETQQHPIWIFSLRNFSIGFNGLNKNLSDAEIAQKFSGVPTPGVTARKTSTITAQVDTRLSRSSHANEFFVNLGADFKEQSTGDVAPQLVLLNNRATGDTGVIHALRGGRSQTRVGLASYLHVEAPLQKPFSVFSLSTQDRLRITQDRNFLLLPRLGLKWLHRGNSFEGGLEAGREINAFAGYSFNNNGTIVSCLPNTAETFAACVNRLIKAGVVTKNSVASVLLENRPRMGLYSRLNLTVPLHDKVKYVLSEEGDLFFNFHDDNSIDTRYRDISKHSLKFIIWPSFSIGPSLQILLYKNKVNGDFLFQRQFGFETTLTFDLFNRREKLVQIQHKP